MYASHYNTKEAACGCQIFIDVDVSTPSCRCSGGCYDDEIEFEFNSIKIEKACREHGGS